MARGTKGGGRGRKSTKADEGNGKNVHAEKADADKPRRGRRPGSGRKPAAAPPAPAARRKPAAAPAGRAAGGGGRKGQPVPASTRGVSLPHTLADVSRAVNVSATTIKYYLNHLPRLIEFEGHGRKRRFSDRAVQMLSDVRRMLSDENKSLSQIRQELEAGQSGGERHEAAHAAPRAHASSASSAKVSGSLEDLMSVLIQEVRAMRSEVEKLRRTRWLPSD